MSLDSLDACIEDLRIERAKVAKLREALEAVKGWLDKAYYEPVIHPATQQELSEKVQYALGL